MRSEFAFPSTRPLERFVVMRQYAVGSFLLGLAASAGWVGWCSLTVAVAFGLGRWIPLDVALAGVGTANLVAGASLALAGIWTIRWTLDRGSGSA